MVEMAKNILINSSYLPTKALVEQVKLLSENQAILTMKEVVAFLQKKRRKRSILIHMSNLNVKMM